MGKETTADKRIQILNNAARLFVASGCNAISMREIAEECGISKAALYYHFTDKEALILAIFENYLDEIDLLMQASSQAGTTARQRIGFMARSILEQAPNKRSLIRLASQEMPNLTPQVRADFGVSYYRKFVGQIEAILYEGVRSGELRPQDPKISTWILLGMMYPFFYPGHERGSEDVEKVLSMILTVFFDGAKQP
jgi:AcrR family transcriptional regulator